MPSLSGGPNRAFPTSSFPITPPDPAGVAAEPFLLQLPPVGQESLLIGDSLSFQINTDMRLTHLVIDVPDGVLATLEINGSRLHVVTDGLGNRGGMPFQAPYLRVKQAKVTFQNVGIGTAQARYVLIGLPGGE